jgi:hypothetical protein
MINLIDIAHAVTISATIPGTYDTSNATTSAPGAFIADFYQYALVIGGILAFGVIVYGGIRYMTSAGNPSGQGDAKEWIQAAIMGILLLAGAYFILKVINPNLVNLNLPSPGQPSTYSGSSGTGGGTGGGGGTTPGTCTNCQKLANCTATSKTNCGGTPAMAKVVNCIDNSDSNFTVNEAYPPVVDHSDPGHNTGCAIDVHVSSCAAGATFMAAAQACGVAHPLNEYSGCSGSKVYKTTTGGNIHIDAPKGSGGC